MTIPLKVSPWPQRTVCLSNNNLKYLLYQPLLPFSGLVFQRDNRHQDTHLSSGRYVQHPLSVSSSLGGWGDQNLLIHKTGQRSSPKL
jgi:hypothetical protein